MEALPEDAVASNPPSEPCDGPETTDHVSVLPAARSLTVSKELIVLAPEFSQTVSDCGLLLVNMIGFTTFTENGYPILVQPFVT